MKTSPIPKLTSWFFISFVLVFSLNAYSQPFVEWERDTDLSVSSDIEELPNGDYLLRADDLDEPDGFGFLRVNSCGTIEQDYELSNPEYTHSYFELYESDMVIAGLSVGHEPSTSSFGIIDSNGQLLWESENGLGWGNFHSNAMGGFVRGSFYYPNYPSLDSSYAIIYSYNSEGIISWYQEYTDESYTLADVTCDIQGAIYVPIYTNDINRKIVLKKLDSTGNLLEETNYISEQDSFINVRTITIKAEGNLYLTGSFPLDPVETYQAIVISPDGDILEMLDSGQATTVSRDLHLTQDGGYLAQSIISGQYIDDELHIIRYDASFNELWTYVYHLPNMREYTKFVRVNPLITRRGEIVLNVLAEEYIGGDDYVYSNYLAKLSAVPTDVVLQVWPYGELDAVQAPGQFFWHGRLTNHTDADITTDVWVITRGPHGYPSEPIQVWEDVLVPANDDFTANLRQLVPPGAMPGEYNYIVRVGDYDENDPQHAVQAYFTLTVTDDEPQPGEQVGADSVPPRTRGVVPAPFDGPVVASSAELR